MKLTLLLFTILCGTIPAVARKYCQARIDSLPTALPAQQEDTGKVWLLNNRSLTYYGTNPAEGLRHATEGLALAKKLD